MGHSRSLVGHSLIRHYLSGHRTLLWNTLVEHSCGDTLVEHSYRTILSASCGTPLRDTLVGHSYRKSLWDTFVGCRKLLWDTCRTLLWDTLVGHLWVTLGETLVEHSERTLLWDTLSGHSVL